MPILSAIFGNDKTLTDMLVRKGWYPAFNRPEDQLKMSYEESQKVK